MISQKEVNTFLECADELQMKKYIYKARKEEIAELKFHLIMELNFKLYTVLQKYFYLEFPV